MTLSVAPKEIAGHGLLDGKVVVVTAAAGTGIGSATARRALAEGADVVISDHHERRLGESAVELSALGQGRVESVVCDVTSTAQVDALIQSATARMGRIDVLVNNAGLGGQTPVADMTDEEWDRVLDVTLTSVFRATRAALRYFRAAPHGGFSHARRPPATYPNQMAFPCPQARPPRSDWCRADRHDRPTAASPSMRW